MMSVSTAVVIGVGAERGIGGASCRRFAREGYHVLVAGRTAEKIARVVEGIHAVGHSAEPVRIDTTVEADVLALFDKAMAPGAGKDPVSVVAFNSASLNIPFDFCELSAEQFEETWRQNCLAGFLVGREAARRLVPLGRGTVIFTGASGSMRGKPRFAQFAAAKSGLRMVAQSMAREFGPRGIHVAHVVIDGGVGGDRLLTNLPGIEQALGADGMLDPEAIAETFWQIHRQPRSTWAHEIDLRPFKETF
jgi:NAD(P)-dependent dehydrogenase (short-subunit alcohol dehydrogenase family)